MIIDKILRLRLFPKIIILCKYEFSLYVFPGKFSESTTYVRSTINGSVYIYVCICNDRMSRDMCELPTLCCTVKMVVS